LAYPSGIGSARNGRPAASAADQFRIVCQTTLDALLVVDDERRVVRVNRAATKLYRVSVEQFLASRLDDFSPPEYFEVLVDLWARFEHEGAQQGHYEVLRGDGTRTMVEYRARRDFGDGEHLIAAREVVGRPPLEDGLWAQRVRMQLSPRELEVLQLVAAGNSGPEIGELLFVSPGTVKTHLKNIYGKLGARDRGSAVAEGLRRGLIR
jgi:PAS domain S-box-containing protein